MQLDKYVVCCAGTVIVGLGISATIRSFWSLPAYTFWRHEMTQKRTNT